MIPELILFVSRGITVYVYKNWETQLVHAIHYENINYFIFPVMLSDVVILPFCSDDSAR